MRIIKKPILPNQICERCKCEFAIKPKNLLPHRYYSNRSEVECPVCRYKFECNFEGAGNGNND